MNTMSSVAENELLPKFQALTGMHPDCPIPGYMRLDANLFFANFFSFRGAWPHLAGPAAALAGSASASAGSAPASATSSLVAPTAGTGQQFTNSTAAEATSTMGSQLAPKPAACMKVDRGIDTKHQLIL
jgi:hypothetical protein